MFRFSIKISGGEVWTMMLAMDMYKDHLNKLEPFQKLAVDTERRHIKYIEDEIQRNRNK